MYSNNGTERWNKTISHKYINGQIYVSPTDTYVIYGYSSGNNTFNIYIRHINNASLVWNKTVYGDAQYNVDSLALFRSVASENRLILSPSTDWKGKALKVYDITTGKPIYMTTSSTYPTGPINFIDSKSIVYSVGDGDIKNINSNWLSNGSYRDLNISNIRSLQWSFFTGS